jgi:transposase InsO family protein
LKKAVCHEEETVFNRSDRCGAQAGGTGNARCRHHPSNRHSRPGKPTDNSYAETFNGSFRDECLNLHWFATLEEAKVIIETWRQDYNESRPHTALNDLSPAEFARKTVCRSQELDSLYAEN